MLSSLSSYPVPQLVSLWQRKEPSVFMQIWPVTQLWLPVRHSLTSEEWDIKSKIRAAVNMQPGLIHKSCHSRAITCNIWEEDAFCSTTHPHSSLHPFAVDNHQGMHMCHYRHTAGNKWNLKAQWDTWRKTCTVSATWYTKSHSVTHIPGSWRTKPARGWCVCLWLWINFEDDNNNEGTKPLQVSVSSGGLAVTLVSGFSVTDSV